MQSVHGCADRVRDAGVRSHGDVHGLRPPAVRVPDLPPVRRPGSAHLSRLSFSRRCHRWLLSTAGPVPVPDSTRGVSPCSLLVPALVVCFPKPQSTEQTDFPCTSIYFHHRRETSKPLSFVKSIFKRVQQATGHPNFWSSAISSTLAVMVQTISCVNFRFVVNNVWRAIILVLSRSSAFQGAFQVIMFAIIWIVWGLYVQYLKWDNVLCYGLWLRSWVSKHEESFVFYPKYSPKGSVWYFRASLCVFLDSGLTVGAREFILDEKYIGSHDVSSRLSIRKPMKQLRQLKLTWNRLWSYRD